MSVSGFIGIFALFKIPANDIVLQIEVGPYNVSFSSRRNLFNESTLAVWLGIVSILPVIFDPALTFFAQGCLEKKFSNGFAVCVCKPFNILAFKASV